MDDLTLYALIWVGSAVLAWFIAHTKKAPDAGTWAFWGLLLGPLGVLAAIAFAKPGEVIAEGRVCANCGKVVAADRTRLCNNCGKPFAATA